MLPNFLIIGVQKCATSWLDYCLRQHPEIFIPKYKHKKEVNFFDKEFEKGIKWYERRFEGAEGYKAIGEASVSYIISPECPQRIAKFIPDVKIIISLRDPVYRAFSQYKMILRRKGLSPKKFSFKDCYNKYPAVIERGMYYKQIKRYFNYFSVDQFHIAFYDDIKATPLKEIKRIVNFLNVNEEYISKIDIIGDTYTRNISTGYYFPFINRLFVLSYKNLDKMELYMLGKKLKNIDRFISKFNSKKIVIEMEENDKDYLHDIFRIEIIKLSNLIGKSLDKWLK